MVCISGRNGVCCLILINNDHFFVNSMSGGANDMLESLVNLPDSPVALIHNTHCIEHAVMARLFDLTAMHNQVQRYDLILV